MLLTEHPLVSVIVQRASPILASSMDEYLEKRERTFDGENNNFTESQKYHLNAFCYITGILNAVERMDDIQWIYLRSFPQSLEQEGINEDKWVDYHYSYYLITTISIYDVSLLLVNAILGLGIKPKDCNWKNITKKLDSLFPNAAYIAILERLYSVIEIYRAPRNLYIHYGQDPNIGNVEDLNLFNAIRFINSTQTINSSAQIGLDILRKVNQIERLGLLRKLMQKTDVISKVLEELFDSLYPSYLLATTYLDSPD